MNKKYLLPPLIEDNDINNDGCWENHDNPYDFLIKKMKLQNEPNVSIFEGGSNAVPHVFEQMILFHDAFLDEKHPEHKRAVIEWKAILILLALQKTQNINISLKKVEFNKNTSNPFLSAAIMFLPEDLPVFYQTTWDFLYIICLKGKPVALVSPITLVCPSKQFMKKVSNGMEKTLIKLEKVNGEDKIFLTVEDKGLAYSNISAWLKNLKSKLSSFRPENSEVQRKAERVKKELDEFIQECNANIVNVLNIPFRENIYPIMNNSIRKEYEFLNFCCDFNVKNEKLEFLVHRYQEDIFEDNIAVLVKDKMPDTMWQLENIQVLEKIFPNTLTINGESVIFLKKYSGEKMAACILVPFKRKFVQELIEQHLVAEEFFEKFSAIYDVDSETIKVSLQVSEFEYIFDKVYSKEQWKYMYADDIPPVYFWPKAQMRVSNWSVYYIYAENNREIKLSVPLNKGNIKYKDVTGEEEKVLFQLVGTDDFVSYLQFNNKEASGYLPIKIAYEGINSVGKTLEVFVDIGHTTTYINMVKKISDDEYENIPFCIPNSLKVADNGKKNDVASNFLSEDGTWGQTRKVKYLKNMLHCFRDYTLEGMNNEKLCPFSTGQILFDAQAYCGNNNAKISFFNFEYCNSDEMERRNVHTFMEQLLLYVAYQAKKIDCSYLKIHFLHDVQENSTCYGEIFGLWKNVLKLVKEWTGIKSTYSIDIDSLEEYKALAYRTYFNASKQKEISAENMYVGIDIGWKKALVASFKGVDFNSQEPLMMYHSRIEYAGCDISLMKENVLAVPEFFNIYSELLSILLTGSMQYKENEEFGNLLKTFEKYCKGIDRQHNSYYQGIFDLIAIMIEERIGKVSTDIYNTMPEFRKFIGILTYNLFLLFLDIGCILGKVSKEINKKVNELYIYVGGNGAKFIRWILNLKEERMINEENCRNMFILGTDESILDIIKNGFKITTNPKNLPNQIYIILSEEEKEQLVKGFMFKESFRIGEQNEVKQNNSISYPKFEYEKIDNTFIDKKQKEDFEYTSNKMREDIFEEKQEEASKKNNMSNEDKQEDVSKTDEVPTTDKEDVSKTDATSNVEKKEESKEKQCFEEKISIKIDELISEKSKLVCRDIIKNLHQMQNGQDK